MINKPIKKHQPKTRTDALINKAKIIKVVLKNPLKTERQIAKETGVPNSTVHEHLKQLNTGKNEHIQAICRVDIENVTLGQQILQARLKEQGKTLKVGEIVDIIQEGTKRYTLFKGEATDEDGGLKNPLTPEEQKKLLDRFKIDQSEKD